jgi:anaerobic ribonucleoside-triphosphate reductase activating protein
MNYGNIKYNDIANGPGVRTSLFVSGCRNRCPGCFQPETWDFKYGKPFTLNEWESIINSMTQYHTGITLLGGDPLEKENMCELLPFVKEFKRRCPDKTIWVYTGYIYENIKEIDLVNEFLSYIDVLVDGPFIQSLHSIKLKFKGSSNQRIIDLKKSKCKNKLVIIG